LPAKQGVQGGGDDVGFEVGSVGGGRAWVAVFYLKGADQGGEELSAPAGLRGEWQEDM
jgi:hypothetical protein